MLISQSVLSYCCESFRNTTTRIAEILDIDGYQISSANIPASLTCCLLKIIDYDVDVVNNELHPIYSIIPDQHQIEPVEYPNFGDEISTTPAPNNKNYTNNGSIDYSQFDFIKPIWNVKPEWEFAVKCIAVVPVVILAILGNLAVIRVVLKARLTRNPVNLFILNMSIADLLTALIFPWIFLAYDLFQKYILGSFICQFEGSVLFALMLISVMSLTVISYDRLTAILFPFKKRMQPKNAKIIIYCIWLISFGISSPLIAWREYKERQWKNFLEAYCKENLSKASKLFHVLFLVVLVWVPLAALTISYTAIVIKLEALEKRQRDHPIKQVKYKSKVVRMLFVVVIVFCLCWIPYTAFIFERNQEVASSTQNSETFETLFFLGHYLMFVNTAINPIIYGLKNDNLKREFRRAVPDCCKKKKRIHISTVFQNNGNGDQGKQVDSRDVKFQNGDRWTKWMKTAETDDKSLFTSKEKGIATLNSFERRNSALYDLGLPVPIFTSTSDDSWRTLN